MKHAMILYNPGAGKEDVRKKALVSLVEEAGYSCGYSSTKKKGWNELDPETDFLVVAGGDGTVSKVADFLLGRTLAEKQYPIALIPSGTANNIARMLNLGSDNKKLAASWSKNIRKPFDAGIIANLSGAHFFLEGFGFGVFPALIKAMKGENKEAIESPEAELQHALKILHEIIHSYEPAYCRIEIDEVDYSGKYLMVEIMNIASIGPNLDLAPKANVSDGKFEVIMITENDRQNLADLVQGKVKNIKAVSSWLKPVKAESIKIQWEGDDIHVDDRIVTMKKTEEVTIHVQKSVLEFLVPE